jgi:hypothetical protein
MATRRVEDTTAAKRQAGAVLHNRHVAQVDTNCRLTPATNRAPAIRYSSFSSFERHVSTNVRRRYRRCLGEF